LECKKINLTIKMSALNKGKHVIGEFDGVRCTIVESGVNKDRASFLKDLLQFNKYEVKILEEVQPEGETKYTVGVTDIIFNPVIAVFSRKLKTKDGQIVSPAYWDQKTTVCDSRYWIIRAKRI
jgi:hypothetical protein